MQDRRWQIRLFGHTLCKKRGEARARENAMTLAGQEERVGPFRIPRNTAQEIKGSIHMDQFVPALLDLYGPAWFKTGGLSLMFKQATVDGEAVRAVVKAGADRAALTMFN